MTRLTELVHEYGDLDGLAAAAVAGAKSASRSRIRRKPIVGHDPGQVLDAIVVKLIARDEARRLLGIPTRPRTTRAKGDTIVTTALNGAGT